MNFPNKNDAVQNLLLIRKITSNHLPIGHSFIPYDILLAVINSEQTGVELSVKALFTNLPYSDMGMRYHFKQLIDKGWIQLHNYPKDARIKLVKPTLKLRDSVGLLEKSFQSIFIDSTEPPSP